MKILHSILAAAILFIAAPAEAATTRVDPRPVRILCKVISTSNLTLSGAQTIDSVAVVAGDVVCAVAQSDNKNAAYLVQSGAWKVIDPGIGTGVEFYALQGSSNVNKVYGCDTTGAITWGATTTSCTLKSSSGAAFNPASPGAIGGTTPAAITGTRITANTGFTGVLGDATPAAVTGTTVTANSSLVSKVVEIPDDLGSNPSPTTGRIKLYRPTTGDFLIQQAGTGDVLSQANLSGSGTSAVDHRYYVKSMLNDGTFDITIPSGGRGWITAPGPSGSVSCAFSFGASGATTDNGITGTSCAVADTDTKLCAYAGAAGHLIVKNRLGSTQTVLIELTMPTAP